MSKNEDVVERMKLIGYGLLKDGKTFYQLGMELDPRGGITFNMAQAYVITDAYSQGQQDAIIFNKSELKLIENSLLAQKMDGSFHGVLSTKKRKSIERIVQKIKNTLRHQQRELINSKRKV